MGSLFRMRCIINGIFYRRFSDKIYDIVEFGLRTYLTICSLGWKLMASLGQDEVIYTHAHPYTRHFRREACQERRVGANIQEVETSANTAFLKAIRYQLNSDIENICKLMQELKTYKKYFQRKIWKRK